MDNMEVGYSVFFQAKTNEKSAFWLLKMDRIISVCPPLRSNADDQVLVNSQEAQSFVSKAQMRFL